MNQNRVLAMKSNVSMSYHFGTAALAIPTITIAVMWWAMLPPPHSNFYHAAGITLVCVCGAVLSELIAIGQFSLNSILVGVCGASSLMLSYQLLRLLQLPWAVVAITATGLATLVAFFLAQRLMKII